MNRQAEAISRPSRPRARAASLISRKRLVSRLMGADDDSVVLIDAPAGFGKSTVLSEWESARPAAVRLAHRSATATTIRCF